MKTITKYVIKDPQTGEYLRQHYYSVYNCSKRKYERKEDGYVRVGFELATLFDKETDAVAIKDLYSREYEVKSVKVSIE